MDGMNIQDEYFDGRIAAEMRLWEALENELFSPFHYFGVTDNTDMSALAWKRGAYDASALSNLVTGNDARARLIVQAVMDKVTDPGSMRALGFCVSVQHAHFMADYFRRAGLNAIALSGETPHEDRRTALDALRSGNVQVIFSVDLFNEGLDIPDVDTLLLLRPTSSATVFLQQLGRGLRRSEGKAVLTVLDFIGQHRKEFRFEEQFRALTNLTRNRLLANIEQDFPQLPSGCQIVLEPKAKDLILDNIRSQISVNVTQLAREVRRYGESRLAAYLRESGRELKEIYRGNGNSWTGLLRRSGLLDGLPPKAKRGSSSESPPSSTSMIQSGWRPTLSSSRTTPHTTTISAHGVRRTPACSTSPSGLLAGMPPTRKRWTSWSPTTPSGTSFAKYWRMPSTERTTCQSLWSMTSPGSR